MLNKRTEMLHTTKRWTQPWKAGLPVDFNPADELRAFPPLFQPERERRAI